MLGLKFSSVSKLFGKGPLRLCTTSDTLMSNTSNTNGTRNACGASKTSNTRYKINTSKTSNTSNASNESRASASVSRISSYFFIKTVILFNPKNFAYSHPQEQLSLLDNSSPKQVGTFRKPWNCWVSIYHFIFVTERAFGKSVRFHY